MSGQHPPNPYESPGPGSAAPGQAVAYAVPVPYAPWIKRVGASLIDGLVALVASIPTLLGYALIIGAVATGTETDPATGLVTSSDPNTPLMVAGMLVALVGFAISIAVFVWNVCLKQGRTGYTVGKGVLGIKLIGEQTGQPIGAGMSFVRALAHILDSLSFYVGYLWPLWDQKRQTFADKVMSTVVIEAPKP